MSGAKADQWVGGVIDVIDSIEAQTDSEELLSVLSDYAKNLGLNHSSIAQIANPAIIERPITDYGVSDFPIEWQIRWLEEEHGFHDPIVHYALRTQAHFTWKEARDHADVFGQRIHDRGRDFGLNQGLAIPVHISGKPPGVLSFAQDGERMSRREASIFEVICVHAYVQFMKIEELGLDYDAPRILSTAREREVLHYIAAGKTAWETSRILGISEATVVKHLSNLSEKLQTQNRTHTVTLGIRSGLILP